MSSHIPYRYLDILGECNRLVHGPPQLSPPSPPVRTRLSYMHTYMHPQIVQITQRLRRQARNTYQSKRVDRQQLLLGERIYSSCASCSSGAQVTVPYVCRYRPWQGLSLPRDDSGLLADWRAISMTLLGMYRLFLRPEQDDLVERCAFRRQEGSFRP